jgi:hypothetical protein
MHYPTQFYYFHYKFSAPKIVEVGNSKATSVEHTVGATVSWRLMGGASG